MTYETHETSDTDRIGTADHAAQAATDQILSAANLSLAKIPLLEGESGDDLNSFRIAAMAAIQPRDAIEAVWLQDFISYTWESMRLRRLKVDFVTKAQTAALHRILNNLSSDELPVSTQKVLIRNWAKQDPAAIDEVNRLLTSLGQSMDSVVATAFKDQLDYIDQVERLIGHYDQRRDNAIKELDKRRDTLARRAYVFSQTFSDANFTEDNGAMEVPGGIPGGISENATQAT